MIIKKDFKPNLHITNTEERSPYYKKSDLESLHNSTVISFLGVQSMIIGLMR